MKRILSIVIMLFACLLPAEDILTVAGSSNYLRTSSYAEVMDFLYQAQKING